MRIRGLLTTMSLLATLIALGGGCAGRTTIFPSEDPSLRKTPAEFAADAAKRTYPADAPRGGRAVGRAQVGYGLDQMEIINSSDQDWADVEVWVNKEYVVFLPKVQHYTDESPTHRFNFRTLYNKNGKSFPIDNVFVDTLEIYRDGKLYDMTVKQAD